MKKIYLKIFNVVMLILILLTFELGYCNHTFSENLIKNREITEFYISPFRIIFYIAMIAIILIFNKKYNFEETEQSLKNKMKKVSLIIFAIISILMIGSLILIKDTVYMTELSLILILLFTVFIAIIYFSKDYTKNIILIGMIASIFTVSTDTYHELDEKKYFMQSYNISYFNFNYNYSIVDTLFMYNMVPRDKISEYYKIKYEYQENTLENMPKEMRSDSTPANYNDIFFLASSFGIFIARILNGSMADIFVMGRLCNLILYIFLIRYALKLIPFKKNILFLIASMPMLLALSASYSIDGLGFAIAMIFVAGILKIYDEKGQKLNSKILLITFVSFAILLSYKFMAYIFLGLLIFILPLKDIIKENKKQIIKTFLIALGILILLYTSQFIKGSISVNDQRGGDTNAVEQIKYILKNPIIFAKTMINTLSTHYLNYSWWTNLHMYIFFGEKSSNIFFIILLYYFYVAVSDTSKNFNKKEKSILIIIYVLTMLFITSVMYATFNTIGATIVNGVQARYMYIVLPLLMFTISSNKLVKNEEKATSNSNIMIPQMIILFVSTIQTIL